MFSQNGLAKANPVKPKAESVLDAASAAARALGTM